MAILAQADATKSQNTVERTSAPAVAHQSAPVDPVGIPSHFETRFSQQAARLRQGATPWGYEKLLLPVVVVLVLVSAFIGCSSVRKADESPSDWFLVGTDGSRFVFRHNHRSYKAECSAAMITGYPESINHDCELLLYYINGKPLNDVNLVEEKLEVGSARRKGSLYCVLKVTGIVDGDK